jgi:integrase/recombinase XerC
MNALVPLSQSTQLSTRQLDAENLIERWKEGRSPQTLRAYAADLMVFAAWMKAPAAGAAVNTLLTMTPGEANEQVRAWRSSMIDHGVAPATVNRRLSALRSLVAPPL